MKCAVEKEDHNKHHTTQVLHKLRSLSIGETLCQKESHIVKILEEGSPSINIGFVVSRDDMPIILFGLASDVTPNPFSL